jgi:hypothetical protein
MTTVLKQLPLKILLPFLLFAITAASCKSKKNLAKHNPVTVVDTTSEKCKMDFKSGKSLK